MNMDRAASWHISGQTLFYHENTMLRLFGLETVYHSRILVKLQGSMKNFVIKAPRSLLGTVLPF